MIVFVDHTALDEGRTEEPAVVIPTFIGEPEEAKEDHRTKYGSPSSDLSGDVKGTILDPEYLWEEVDTTEIIVCVRPASPGGKWEGSGVEVDLDHG